MKIDKENLVEFEDTLNALEEMVGIEPSAIIEIRDAIMTANIMLNHPDTITDLKDDNSEDYYNRDKLFERKR